VAEGASKAGKAMSAIPWMLIIGFAIELAMAFYDIASGAAAAREAQEKFDKSSAASQKQAEERVSKRQENLQKEIAALQRLRNENKITETEFLKRKQYALNLTQKQIQADIKSVNERKKQYNEELKVAAAISEKIKKQGDATTLNKEEIQFLKDRNAYFNVERNHLDVVADLQANIGGVNAKITEYRKELDQANESTKDATSDVNAMSSAEENDTDIKFKKTKTVKELNTQMEKYNEYLTVQNQLLADLEQIQAENKVQNISTEITTLTEELQMLADEGINADTSVVEQKIRERYNLEKQLIQQKLDAEIAAINERYRVDAEKAKQAVTDNYLKLISQEGLSPAERSKIDAQYKEQMDLLAQDQLQRNADLDLELKVLKEQTNQEQLELDKEYNSEVLDLKNDLNDRILDKENERLNNEDENRKKTLDKEKKAAEDRGAIIQALADLAILQSQKKVAAIEKEIEAAQKGADYLQELAAQGNIDAKESLAAQNQLIAEANQRKEAELKKQERILFANSVYQTYQKNAADESVKNPLAKTITDVSLLTQFIKTFPAFLDGTEDTGVNGQGVDGKGGFHAILHPNERVMTKDQNAMTGGLSNESLAKIAQEYNAGQIIHKGEAAAQIGGAWQSAAVLKQLEDLTRAISTKPETNIELGEILDGAMTIIKSQKKGNQIVYNRYKIK
jgi:hypothetical protein